MSEDTNTNEKKFHLDEFAMLLGNRMNARREEGGQVWLEAPVFIRIAAARPMTRRIEPIYDTRCKSSSFSKVHVTKRQLVTFGEQIARSVSKQSTELKYLKQAFFPLLQLGFQEIQPRSNPHFYQRSNQHRGA